MECFVIFVMAWFWFNATESKPQNVMRHLKKTKRLGKIHRPDRGQNEKLKN